MDKFITYSELLALTVLLDLGLVNYLGHLSLDIRVFFAVVFLLVIVFELITFNRRYRSTSKARAKSI